MNLKVSIIVPVYNTAKYLEECIKSLERIDFESYEVLFVDNCSNDGSYQILKKLKNKNFKIFRNKKNYGQSYSLNKAIKNSNSPYIAIMDSDDVCLPNRIKDSFNFLEKNPDHCLVAGKSNTINEFGKILKKRRFTLNNNLIQTRIYIDNPFSHTTIMFRSKALKNIKSYSRKFKYTQDFDLISRLIRKGFKVKILDKQFTLVRKHRSQQSFKNKNKQLLERYLIAQTNIKKKIKISSNIKLLIKFIIFKKDKRFQNFSSVKQIEIIIFFLNKIFIKNNEKLYFCSLIFSQPNNFRKEIIFKVLLKYLFLNKILIKEKETILRLGRSLFKLVF